MIKKIIIQERALKPKTDLVDFSNKEAKKEIVNRIELLTRRGVVLIDLALIKNNKTCLDYILENHSNDRYVILVDSKEEREYTSSFVDDKNVFQTDDKCHAILLAHSIISNTALNDIYIIGETLIESIGDDIEKLIEHKTMYIAYTLTNENEECTDFIDTPSDSKIYKWEMDVDRVDCVRVSCDEIPNTAYTITTDICMRRYSKHNTRE